MTMFRTERSPAQIPSIKDVRSHEKTPTLNAILASDTQLICNTVTFSCLLTLRHLHAEKSAKKKEIKYRLVFLPVCAFRCSGRRTFHSTVGDRAKALC